MENVKMNWNQIFIITFVMSIIQFSSCAQSDVLSKKEIDARAFYKQAYFADKKDQYKLAFSHYKKAAELGHLEAIFSVGSMYENGLGVMKSSSQAVDWYKKATLQNYAKAQYNLAVMYYYGKGVKKDMALGMRLYLKAAKQEHAAAQNSLGAIYNAGKGVKKDEKKAFEWYKKSAENGNVLAQDNLGMKYTLGQGVDLDYVQAYIWLSLAAMQGDEVAVFHRYILRPKLNAKQLKQARAEVRKRYVKLYLK